MIKFMLCLLLTLFITFSNTFIIDTSQNIYANLSSDEIFTPDQYAFNVSCLGCFIP